MMVVCRDRIMVTVLWRWEHGSGSEQGVGSMVMGEWMA